MYQKNLYRTNSDALEDQAAIEPSKATDANTGDGLPEYSWAEISKHKTVDDGIWVTCSGNVYDITEFVEGHPGGNFLIKNC